MIEDRRIDCADPERVVREAFWLAYQAAGRPAGMGVFKARTDATRDEVWANVRSAGDYGPGADKIMGSDKPGRAYGDYVFGRMLKLVLRWDAKGVFFDDRALRPDYEAWCTVYPTTEALVRAAIASAAEQS